MFYEKVFLALAREKIRYAIVGGVAVNLHGIPRMTADLDLIVDLQPENLQKFLNVMVELGYTPRLPLPANDLLSLEKRQDWINNRNLHAFSFWNQQSAFEEVDLLLPESEDSKLIERAEIIELDKTTLSLIALDDLIEMKKSAARQQDQADVVGLEKLKLVRRNSDHD